MTPPSASADPAIRASGLSKTFGRLVAVDGIDLSIRQGELFALLGPNGAGKTTTIRMLCCLARPTGGTATVLGHDTVREPLAVKAMIDVAPQETAIAEHLDAWENLALMAGLHGLETGETRERSQDLLGMMGLLERADEKVGRYSGGMKRRLSLAMALVSGPRILFLDEPTLGLDPQSRRAIWEHVRTLKGEITIVLTTHYLEEADALADRIAIVDHGEIIALGTPQELKDGIPIARVTVVEAPTATDDDVELLRHRYGEVRRVDGRIEIEGDGITLYDIEDQLRPRGVEIQASYRREITLDDVFLHLTGRQLRP